MFDRAMQALYKLALAPVAETLADPNSYGFRELRRCADAIAAGFNALSKPNSATWVLEGDITGCYDNIRQLWMRENIVTDPEVLRKWLEAGYVENGRLYPTRKGTPQGGIISPILANLTLDGLERAVHEAVPRRSRVNFVRYADDFIITGKSLCLLQEQVKPAVEAFLRERGLELSPEKTVITHITRGFTFLRQTFRKRGQVLRITPSKEGVLALIRKVGALIRAHVAAPMLALVKSSIRRFAAGGTTIATWWHRKRSPVLTSTFESNYGGCCGTATPGSPNASCSVNTGQRRADGISSRSSVRPRRGLGCTRSYGWAPCLRVGILRSGRTPIPTSLNRPDCFGSGETRRSDG